MTNRIEFTGSDLASVDPETELRLPANIGQLPIARAVAADFAMRRGSDIDALADTKIVVDEVCNCLLSNALSESPLICRFSGVDNRIVVRGQVRCAKQEALVRDTFGWQVLHSIADEVLTWTETSNPLLDEQWLHIEVSTAVR